VALLGCFVVSSHRIASHRIASHLIASHLIFSHIIAYHRIASHRIASHRVASYLIASQYIFSHIIAYHRIASHLLAYHRISSHLISSHRIASHRISSHLIASHLISYTISQWNRVINQLIHRLYNAFVYTALSHRSSPFSILRLITHASPLPQYFAWTKSPQFTDGIDPSKGETGKVSMDCVLCVMAWLVS
jgi:hypothetical protein